MDTGVMLIVGLVVGCAIAAVVYVYLRRNLPPEVAEALATYAAAIRSACGNVLDAESITKLAGYVWDANQGSLSQYFTRDDFIAAILRAVKAEPQASANLAIMQVRAKAAERQATACVS